MLEYHVIVTAGGVAKHFDAGEGQQDRFKYYEDFLVSQDYSGRGSWIRGPCTISH